MGSPKTPEIKVDPNIATQEARAQAANIAALQVQAQGDTASIMARFGTRQALSTSGMLAAAPAAPSAFGKPMPVA